MKEEFLNIDYNIIEDKNYLTSEKKISPYFHDNGFDLFDCGQGYYTEEVDVIARIEDKFYAVNIQAEIESAKQDRGDRLYWVGSINNISWNEIPKPIPKERTLHSYSLYLTKEQQSFIDDYIKENKIKHNDELEKLCWRRMVYPTE